VEHLVGEAQPVGHVPGDVALEGPARLSIRQSFQRLAHHHCGDHIGGNGRPTTAGRKQVFELLIREQLAPVIGEDGMHRVRLHQVPAELLGIEQLAIRPGRPCQHQIFLTCAGNANRVDCSAAS
jgi:hypothetical protein